ncbi:hypothetical protein, partial [Stenotrophomonas maltophilia]|uniref:hypothetical protein n=1 Tax=Stenotrophomonas maltophilia TaxID=40324 RepID=UPI00195304C3
LTTPNLTDRPYLGTNPDTADLPKGTAANANQQCGRRLNNIRVTGRLMVNQDDARRVQNKHNAMLLARNGIPVFPSSGKVPLVKLYNRRDTEI